MSNARKFYDEVNEYKTRRKQGLKKSIAFIGNQWAIPAEEAERFYKAGEGDAHPLVEIFTEGQTYVETEVRKFSKENPNVPVLAEGQPVEPVTRETFEEFSKQQMKAAGIGIESTSIGPSPKPYDSNTGIAYTPVEPKARVAFDDRATPALRRMAAAGKEIGDAMTKMAESATKALEPISKMAEKMQAQKAFRRAGNRQWAREKAPLGAKAYVVVDRRGRIERKYDGKAARERAYTYLDKLGREVQAFMRVEAR